MTTDWPLTWTYRASMGQNQAEELVTAGADGADLADRLVIGKKTGIKRVMPPSTLISNKISALDGPRCGRSATMLLTMTAVMRCPRGSRHPEAHRSGRWPHGGQLGGGRGGLCGGALRCSRQRIAVAFTGRHQHRRGEQRRDYKQKTFHCHCSFFQFPVMRYKCSLL